MNLKYRIAFKLRPYGKTKTAYQIQQHVTFNSLRLITSTGCQIEDLSAWDEENQLVKSSYKGPRGETALKINTTLRNCREQMESTFKFFEGNDIIPTKQQVQERYEARLHGTVPQRPAPEPKKERKPKEPDFFKTYDMFLKECGEKNAWTEATFEKMEAMRVDLTTFKKNIKFSDLTEATLTEFVAYMRDSKKLRTPRKKKGERDDYDQEDLVGLKNSTIEKKLGYLRWFLNWATDRGYNTNLDYKKFHPTLKMTQRKVIYLTKEEIARVRDIKELCKLAGINEEIRVTTYKGNVRTDKIQPKWELVGTHTGRRTFIVNALSLGITPNIVMKWTGHSDYKAMKPYIDIVDSIKASSMTKFDGLI